MKRSMLVGSAVFAFVLQGMVVAQVEQPVFVVPGSAAEVEWVSEMNGEAIIALDDGDIFASNGTTAGTRLIAQAGTGSTGIWATVASGTLFYADPSGRIFTYRAGATALVRSSPLSNFRHGLGVQGRAFFNADDGVHGDELWVSDGTPAGTYMVKDINPGLPGSSIAEAMVELHGVLYFLANDGVHGLELWRSDGTEAGTRLAADIAGGVTSGASPFSLMVANRKDDVVWLTARDGTLPCSLQSGWQPWRVHTSGLSAFWRISGFGCDTGLDDLTIIGDRLWCSAAETLGTCPSFCAPVTGPEPFTELVGLLDLIPGSTGSGPGEFTDVGGVPVYRATTPETGTDLFLGISPHEIEPGMNGSAPGNLLDAGGLVYLAASRVASGRELWVMRSNGPLVFATWPLSMIEIAPGIADSNPEPLVLAGGKLFFAATDGTRSGLWQLFPGATAQSIGHSCGSNFSQPRLRSTRPVRGRRTQVVGDDTPDAYALLAGVRAPVPLPLGGGCEMYLDLTQPIVTIASGSTAPSSPFSVSLPIPDVSALDGQGVVLQTINLTASSLRFSNGMLLTIGPR